MNIQTLLVNILTFINGTVIPFLIAIAFVIFIWNAFRYFILGGSNPEAQEKARSLALWSVLAFVIITSLWGIVNLLVAGLGFGNRAIIPDYMCNKLGGSCQTTGGSSGNIFAPTPEDDEDLNNRFDSGKYNPGEAPNSGTEI